MPSEKALQSFTGCAARAASRDKDERETRALDSHFYGRDLPRRAGRSPPYRPLGSETLAERLKSPYHYPADCEQRPGSRRIAPDSHLFSQGLRGSLFLGFRRLEMNAPATWAT